VGPRRLYLLVSTSLRASWIYRYQDNGKKHDHGLGPYPDVSLADARKARLKCDGLRRDGIDPIAARKAARAKAKLDTAKAMTFKDCAAAYIKAHMAGWRNPKHAAQWPNTLAAYVYPVFGSLPVQDVDVGLVMRALEPIWREKPETASRVRGRIENVLDWATARGYRQGENPARWRGHLENLLPKKTKVQRVEHHAALPYAELPEFMVELQRREGVAARALEFLALTAVRTGEVRGAKWSEINLVQRLWTIPAERVKAGREHRVPLSDAAMAILGQMQEIRQSDYVFPGGKVRRPLNHAALLEVLQRMGRSDLTVHGLRSTFRDWTAEQSSFPHEVAEMALGHVVANAVERAYRRGDLFQKRRQVMDAWARFCTAAPAASGKAVSFAAAE